MSGVAQARIVAKNRIVAQTRIVALRPLTDHQGVFSSVLTKMLLNFLSALMLTALVLVSVQIWMLQAIFARKKHVDFISPRI